MSHYAKNFENYRRFLNKILRYDLRMFDIPKESRILDVGCGFGEDVVRLQKLGYGNVIGIDPDPFCIEKRGNLDLRLGSLEQTGLESQSFDIVLVNNVFHHISEYKDGLEEISRVLKPGGMLCLIEPRPSVLRWLMDFITFKTPLPGLLGGPLRMRYLVMSEEIATGLYPKWLKGNREFIKLFRRSFNLLWLKKGAFFYISKARKPG
ncbi:MAG: class I SAM-dependent methyltransferase [Nitrospinota bacterium]|nr:class I SAM-dependent methyltransferase [Nitrospinota bacterium]